MRLMYLSSGNVFILDLSPEKCEREKETGGCGVGSAYSYVVERREKRNFTYSTHTRGRIGGAAAGGLIDPKKDRPPLCPPPQKKDFWASSIRQNKRAASVLLSPSKRDFLPLQIYDLSGFSLLLTPRGSFFFEMATAICCET